MTKSLIQKTSMAASGAFLLVAAQVAIAGPITLTPNADNELNVVRALKAVDVQNYFETSTPLELLYKSDFGEGESDSGTFSGSYSTEFTVNEGNEPGEPNNAFIRFNAGENYIQCPECYLVVKDGKEPQYLFDIGTWDGTSEISLLDFYPNKGAISHVAIFGAYSDVPVPEPTTAFLLATGVFGLFAGRRRMRKAT